MTAIFFNVAAVLAGLYGLLHWAMAESIMHMIFAGTMFITSTLFAVGAAMVKLLKIISVRG